MNLLLNPLLLLYNVELLCFIFFCQCQGKYTLFDKRWHIWGYFLSSEYDTQNTLIHDELKNIPGFIRSGWSQRMKYVTEFDFIDGNWYSDLSKHLGKDLELSDSGVLFKEKIHNN